MYESTGSTKLTWRLDGNDLHCMTSSGNGSCDYRVKVLAEELAYNKSLKQFKMFIIEKPLDPNYKVSNSDFNATMVTWYVAPGAGFTET